MVKSKIKVHKNVVYSETELEKLTADIYMPAEGEDLPAVILIHGGAYQSGSKEMYSEWGPYLAEAGFVAMAVNYRLATPTYSTWPGVMEDIDQAVNWLVGKSNEWNINPLKLALIGDSAGAQIGSIYSFQSKARSSFKIQACVGIYGVFDLANPKTSREAMMFQRLIGKPVDEAPELYKEASPKNYIEEAAASPTFDTDFFLVWGDSDNIAAPAHSEGLVKEMQEAGLNVETLVYKDQGHFWFNLTPGLEGGSLNDYPNNDLAPKIVQFLKESLDSSIVGIVSKKHIQRLKDLQKASLKV